MIRVYAGEQQLTEQVLEWLADKSPMYYYPWERSTQVLKRFRQIDADAVVIQIIRKSGDCYRVVDSVEQKDEVVSFVNKMVHKKKKKEKKS